MQYEELGKSLISNLLEKRCIKQSWKMLNSQYDIKQ